jgi:hypothetical protein
MHIEYRRYTIYMQVQDKKKSNKSITTNELQDQEVIPKARTDQEMRYIRVSGVLYSLRLTQPYNHIPSGLPFQQICFFWLL